MLLGCAGRGRQRGRALTENEGSLPQAGERCQGKRRCGDRWRAEWTGEGLAKGTPDQSPRTTPFGWDHGAALCGDGLWALWGQAGHSPQWVRIFSILSAWPDPEGRTVLTRLAVPHRKVLGEIRKDLALFPVIAPKDSTFPEALASLARLRWLSAPQVYDLFLAYTARDNQVTILYTLNDRHFRIPLP